MIVEGNYNLALLQCLLMNDALPEQCSSTSKTESKYNEAVHQL